jgi:DNA repair exonuclease SbcCD nuclease subunit
MLRLLHTADVHLGARHEDLGEAASALRERQHAALHTAVDLALAKHVDVALIAGDLFDANTASRPTVERAVAELSRLAAGRIRIVLVPGDHDAYTRSSVYRAYDLPGLVGGGMLTVLTPAEPWVLLDSLGALVVGPADASRPSAGPFAPVVDPDLPAPTWRIGLLHAAVGSGAGAVSEAELEASGLDFAALGHDHASATGRAGGTTWAVPGAPESGGADADGPGTVNFITLDERDGVKTVTVETRVVGSTRRRDLEVDAGSLASQADLVDQLRALADPELMLSVRVVGERPDELELDPAGVEDALRAEVLHVRVDDRSRPPLTAGPLPPPETIAGAFLRTVEGRIVELEGLDGTEPQDEAAVLREVLRMGRRLLAGAEVAS